MKHETYLSHQDYSFGLFGAVGLSIPFFYLWNWLAPIYMSWLPSLYIHLPFWHTVGLFVLIAIIRATIFPPALFTKKLKYFHC